MSEGVPDYPENRDAAYLRQLIQDSLEELSPAIKNQVAQKFLKTLTGVEVSEKDAVAHWEGILSRQSELSKRLDRRVSLITAAADYCDTTKISRSAALIDSTVLKDLRRDAATDGLTGLYNRRLFDETVPRELLRAQRQSSPLTLILFDLHDFKGTNDTFGHALGDRVLGCFARAVTETIRRSDSGFRIGGDEFAVLLPESDSQNGQGLARRIEDRFVHHSRTLSAEIRAALDYGLASFPGHGDSLEKLFEVADRALYARKRTRLARAVERLAPVHSFHPAPEVHQPISQTGPRIEVPGAEETPEGMKQKRRHIRLSMEGMDARGTLHDGEINDKEIKILDLAHGGIGFLLEESLPLPELFSARLHVPPFRDVDLRFRRVYTLPQKTGILRVGASIAA